LMIASHQYTKIFLKINFICFADAYYLTSYGYNSCGISCIFI